MAEGEFIEIGLQMFAADGADDGLPPLPPITDEEREELREYLKTADVSPGGRAVLVRDFGL